MTYFPLSIPLCFRRVLAETGMNKLFQVDCNVVPESFRPTAEDLMASSVTIVDFDLMNWYSVSPANDLRTHLKSIQTAPYISSSNLH